MEEIVKCVILSHKRAGAVRTLKAVDNCVICIPESQLEDYKVHNPNAEYVCHPDTVVGLSAKIRWVYEQFENVCMLDDDIDYFVRNYVDTTFREPRRIDSQTAYEIIQVSAVMSLQLGVFLFGLASCAKPVAYDSTKPFKLTGWVIGGCVGFLKGFKMELPDECTAACDYFISAINAYNHRRCFIDTRFAVYCNEGTFKSSGGTADIRSMDTERKDFILLRKYFGDAIQKKTGTVNRKQIQNQFERILRIPY